jgi:hypothetical protein
MRLGGRPRAWIWVTAVICALACVVASAATSRSAIILSLAQARGLMAQYHPNASLPTKVPPGVRFADVGGSCSSLGVGGPPCFARLEYITARTGGKSAFQLALFNGTVKAKVVQALLRHDGKFGSTTAFTAGKYAGTRERQWNKAYKIGGVDTYVWQYRTITYALLVRFLDSGAQAFPGTVPRAIIASFTPVKGATPPPAPPPTAQVTMPNVIGKTPEAASDIIFKAGLDARRFGQVPAPTPDLVGKVVQTAPKPGEKAAYGSIVTLYLGV